MKKVHKVMTKSRETKQLAFEKSAKYHIKVQGTLEKRYIDFFGDMQIRVRTREDQPTVTILSGQVRDQCELMGLLNNLYELHLPLVSVELH